MDPRERADATLARARARGAFVVTPESAISPMDAANTVQIPRTLVSAVDRDDDPEVTMVVPAPGGRPRPREASEPAIAQEALTQSLRAPAPRPPRQPERRDGPVGEDVTTPMVRGQPPQPPGPAPPAMPQSQPEPPPAPEQVDGLVPTVKQPPARRSTLSQRLDG